MAANLIEMAKDLFRGEAVGKIADQLGETVPATQGALDSALPALFGGLVSKGSTTAGAGELLDLLKSNNFDGGRLTEIASGLSGGGGISNLISMGGPLLSSIFGPRTDAVTDWLASRSGISRSSSSSLLGLALPAVLGVIGRQVSQDGWNLSSLTNVLGGLKGLAGSLPAGLAGALGMTGLTEGIPVGTPSRPAMESTPLREPVRVPPAAVRSESSWWKWAIPLAVLLGLIPFMRNWFAPAADQTRQPVEQTAGSRETSSTPGTPPGPAATQNPAAPAETVDRRLPGGDELNFGPNSVENKLLGFIQDTNRPVDTTSWFTFDGLEFETSSARLKPSSQSRLKNVAAILKAYPQVALKIGGYTDNVGSPAANVKLSQQRAESTMNELARLGIDRSRLAAEGYGEQHPVDTNETSDGRQNNRRIDVQVTRK